MQQVATEHQVAPYRAWDRDEKLGPVPEGGFKPDDPKVVAWEAAHGHDLRLKCLPELGCQLSYVLVEDVTEALDAIDKHAERDLDHDLHAIVEHYRRALNV